MYKTLPLNSLKIHNQNEPFKPILGQYLIFLFFCYVLSSFTTGFLSKYIVIFHTFIESFCIFAAFILFFVIFCTYQRHTPAFQLLGFGFLAVGIFDLLHTFTFPAFEIHPGGSYDLSMRYWLLGRFTEALVFFVATSKIFPVNIKRWLGTTFSIVLTVSISYIVYFFSNLFPVLFIKNAGLTLSKITIEYIIVAFLAITLFLLRKNIITEKNVLSYRYLSIALLFAVTIELSTMLFATRMNFLLTFKHFLKIGYYCYLLKGIFAGFNTYAYKKPETVSTYINEVLNGLPTGVTTSDSNFKLFFARKRAEEIMECKLGFQCVLNSIINPVIILNKNRQVAMCNRAFTDTVEMDSQELIGLHIDELKKMLQLKTKKLLSKVSQDENLSVISFEAIIDTPKGNKKQVMCYVSQVYDIEGEIIGTIGIVADITKTEKEKERIQQREKLAILGQMASGIVHEIKNPLTTIRGFNQMVLSKTSEASIRQYAEIIEDEIKMVNQVVNDFLTFARPRLPILKACSVNQLVKSIEMMLESELFLKGIEFELELAADEEMVMIDESQIKQVILNIVKNAIDATEDVTSPQLKIKVRFNRDTARMEITIADNGKGISEKDMAKLGTPFFTTKEKGTGLGLSICYQIIKEHSGQIEVESEPGKGTVFTISFPVYSSEERKLVGAQ